MIDDAATVRMYYRQILEELGFVVDEAVNGGEGLEKALGQAYDLFIVDINMPVMDGYTLVRTLRQEQTLQSIPVIMISTEAEAEDKTQAYRVGANLYEIKPVLPEVLSLDVQLLTGMRVS
jgi:two-component system chemotaxis response regulator CheY